MSFTIRLFGNIQVLVDDCEVKTPRSRKSIWILALLTLRQQTTTTRDWLASALWPDSDKSQALANLRTTLSELRGALGQEGRRVETPSRQAVRLDLEGADVDLVEFDRCIASGKRIDLEKAVALYIGPLLEDSSEEWVSQERGAREQDCLKALQTLGKGAYSAADFKEAVLWFRRATILDPFWDEAHRGLMQSLAREGELNEALLAYRAFEERLQSQLGILPDERTSSLYSKLRAQARGDRPSVTVDPPKPSGSVPNPITDLIGREDECMDVAMLLRRSRLVTLFGLGGIGKTRLAIAIANASMPEYAEGCWFVSLDALSDGELVSRQICNTLELREVTGKPWIEIAADHLRSKRALLILDNCEHLLDACVKTCRRLMQECPGVRILATSREALGITGETIWSVPTLPVPDPSHLPHGAAAQQRVIAGYDGVQLFLERASAAKKDFELNASNVEAIAEICFGLQGLPLAIELAAAHVRTLSVHQVLDRLGNHLNLLKGSKREVVLRHHTLRSTLDWSYELLTDSERTLLQRLSVFVGGWTLEAAEQVCQGGEITGADVSSILGSLVEKSLILFSEDGGDVRERFRMLETVRQYATEKLAGSPDEEETERGLRAWSLELSERAGVEILGKDQGRWLRLLNVEYGNLLKALIGYENDPKAGSESLRMASGLMRYWMIRGPHSEGRERLRRSLSHEGAQAESAERALALNCAGTLAFHDSDFRSAKPFFERSLAIRRNLGDRASMVSPATNLGNVYSREGKHAAAFQAYEECLALAEETKQLRARGVVLVNLGYLLLSQMGETRQSRARYEEALKIYRELEEPQGISMSLEGVGFSSEALGDYDSAESCQKEVMALRKGLGDQRVFWSLQNLGSIAFGRGDLPSAKSYFEQTSAAFSESQHQDGVAAAAKYLGHVEQFRGAFDAGAHHYRTALDHYRSQDDFKNIAFVLSGLGDLQIEIGHVEEARRTLTEALTLAGDLAAGRVLAVCLDSFATLLTVEGDAAGGTRLWASTHAVRSRTGEARPTPVAERCHRWQDRARSILGTQAYDLAWSEGLELSMEDAKEAALASVGLPVATP